MAEQRLAKISRAAGKKNGWHVFESVRIPDVEQGGKREIDLVIVGGNTLLVVEQKHWSGSFEINAEEEFLQHRKKRYHAQPQHRQSAHCSQIADARCDAQ